MAPALINAINKPERANVDSAWRGRIFESVVGSYLLTKGYELFYWKDGVHEVDYIAKQGREIKAIEVKSGRPRKMSGLTQFVRQFPEAEPLVLISENFNSSGL